MFHSSYRTTVSFIFFWWRAQKQIMIFSISHKLLVTPDIFCGVSRRTSILLMFPFSQHYVNIFIHVFWMQLSGSVLSAYHCSWCTLVYYYYYSNWCFVNTVVILTLARQAAQQEAGLISHATSRFFHVWHFLESLASTQTSPPSCFCAHLQTWAPSARALFLFLPPPSSLSVSSS